MALELSAPLRAGAELLARLQAMGVRGVRSITLTRNRSVMVSVRDGTLRVHRAFLSAPEGVHRAMARFLMSRRRADRLAARRVLVAFPIDDAERRAPRAGVRTHPDDEALAATLAAWHARYNMERFGGALRVVKVRVSRRMRARLGHYAPAQAGRPAEIAISRRHVKRHGLAAASETLLHEMVHQWQDESGVGLGHEAGFREKARGVGIGGRAKQVVD